MAGRSRLKDSQSLSSVLATGELTKSLWGWGRSLDPWEPPLPQL